MTEADAARYLERALESAPPDERREAVEQIAKTRYLKHEVVLDALCMIATTDHSPAVRCTALGALRRSGDPRIAPALVEVLEQPRLGAAAPTAAPPTADVCLEALRAVVMLAERGILPAEQEPALRNAAIRLVSKERSRDARQTSARFLGYCRDRAVIEPLIDALEQRDFGVVYQSERSLMRLTGQTFDHDSVSWRRWLAQTDDPFAEAGKLDHLLDAPPKGWWRRSIERTRRRLAGFGPKKDDA